jgi:hypothetical protein
LVLVLRPKLGGLGLGLGLVNFGLGLGLVKLGLGLGLDVAVLLTSFYSLVTPSFSNAYFARRQALRQ